MRNKKDKARMQAEKPIESVNTASAEHEENTVSGTGHANQAGEPADTKDDVQGTSAAESAQARNAEAEEEVGALRSDLESLQGEYEAQQDALLRLRAEYDNFRRRSRLEKDELYADAVCDVSTAWLPVLDNLERALKALEGLEGDDARAALEGVSMIKRQAEEVMQKLGIEAIEDLSASFDPQLHEAIMHVEDEAYGESEIIEVFEKGYRKGDRVLRHSMVKVAN